jgi:hypothetical protein
MVIGWLQAGAGAMSQEEREDLFEPALMTEAKLDLIDNAAEGIIGAIRLSIIGRHGPAWLS